MSNYVTSNGLEKVNLGTGVDDFSADNVIDVCSKVNNNIDVVDEVISTVNTLDSNMTILINKGFTSGFINGGATGA